MSDPSSEDPPRSGGGRGRPARISRDRVVEAALEVGFEQLSMTRVARHLGVAPSTLYYHVSGLAELRELASDRHAGRLELPLDAGSDLSELLREAAWALRTFFEESPGLAERCFVDARWPNRILALNERACQTLVRRGFPPDRAWLVVRAIADFVEGFVAREQAAAREGGSRAGPAPAARNPARYPALSAALRELGPDPLQARFDFGLQCILDGLRSSRPVGDVVPIDRYGRGSVGRPGTTHAPANEPLSG